MNIERANKHLQRIACIGSFDIDIKLDEGLLNELQIFLMAMKNLANPFM
jgi:hypothetical protein